MYCNSLTQSTEYTQKCGGLSQTQNRAEMNLKELHVHWFQTDLSFWGNQITYELTWLIQVFKEKNWIHAINFSG